MVHSPVLLFVFYLTLKKGAVTLLLLLRGYFYVSMNRF